MTRLILDLDHRLIFISTSGVVQSFSTTSSTPTEAELPPDLFATLVDLAREGREADFRWLARNAGVVESQLDDLWAGTRLRVQKGENRG